MSQFVAPIKLKTGLSKLALTSQIQIWTHAYQIWDWRVMGTYSPLRIYQIWYWLIMGNYSPLRVYQIWDWQVKGTYSPLRVYQIWDCIESDHI